MLLTLMIELPNSSECYNSASTLLLMVHHRNLDLAPSLTWIDPFVSVSEEVSNQLETKVELEKLLVTLKAYSGELLQVMGELCFTN